MCRLSSSIRVEGVHENLTTTQIYQSDAAHLIQKSTRCTCVRGLASRLDNIASTPGQSELAWSMIDSR